MVSLLLFISLLAERGLDLLFVDQLLVKVVRVVVYALTVSTELAFGTEGTARTGESTGTGRFFGNERCAQNVYAPVQTQKVASHETATEKCLSVEYSLTLGFCRRAL